MRSVSLFSVLIVLQFLQAVARPQTVNMEHPEEIRAQKVPSADAMLARRNNTQLQTDAKELADLSATLPEAMEEVKRGVLPKDLLDKLRRAEKLSKKVREELTQ